MSRIPCQGCLILIQEAVVEKPERLKGVLKKDEIYSDDEFQEYVEAVIDYYFNLQPYHGRSRQTMENSKWMYLTNI